MNTRIRIVIPHVEVLTPLSQIRLMPRLLEQAGRTCYKSEDRITSDSAKKFISALIKSGHDSVIEHQSITVRIVGDRSMSHQLVRHRIAAYSQESQRYCDYVKAQDSQQTEGVLTVICPPTITSSDVISEQIWESDGPKEGAMRDLEPGERDRFLIWLLAIENAYATYLDLRSEGVPPEDARSVLPNATKTEVVATYNLRQWRHVFEVRALNSHAQWQIRGLLLSVLDKFAWLLPCVFGDLANKADPAARRFCVALSDENC